MKLKQYLEKLDKMWSELDFDDSNMSSVHAFDKFTSCLDREMQDYQHSSELWSMKGDWLFGKYLINNEMPEFEARNLCYLNAIKYNSRDYYAYYALGNLYHLHNKDLASAVQCFQKSISLGADARAYSDLARAYSQMGRRDLATECLNSAVEKFGNNSEIKIVVKEIEKGYWDPS